MMGVVGLNKARDKGILTNNILFLRSFGKVQEEFS
jgi:hypothetical protein